MFRALKQALKAWADMKRIEAEFHAVFNCVTESRKDKRRINYLAHCLLVKYIEMGYGLDGIEKLTRGPLDDA